MTTVTRRQGLAFAQSPEPVGRVVYPEYEEEDKPTTMRRTKYPNRIVEEREPNMDSELTDLASEDFTVKIEPCKD